MNGVISLLPHTLYLRFISVYVMLIAVCPFIFYAQINLYRGIQNITDVVINITPLNIAENSFFYLSFVSGLICFRSTLQLQNVPGITVRMSEKYRTVKSLKLISFKIATVKRWKHYWKPFCESLFSSSVAFLIMSVALQKRRSFHADFS